MAQLPLGLSLESLLEHFPYQQHPVMRPSQRRALELAAEHGSVTLEAPTGTGKSAVGLAYLSALVPQSAGPCLYVVPNKTHADGLKRLYPQVETLFGRNEYDCLFYEGHVSPKAHEVPCASLRGCMHRISLLTGKMVIEGSTAEPCPYLNAKYKKLQKGVVVCTMSFFLFNYLFKHNKETLGGLVIDEVHRIASVFRAALSYDISDWHVRRGVELLRRISADNEATILDQFLGAMISILKTKSPTRPMLLEDDELQALLAILRRIDDDALQQKLGAAVRGGQIDPVAERHVLKQLETVALSLKRYVVALEYALPGGERRPLNYVTFAYSSARPHGQEKTQYRLIIRAYHVAGVIRRLLSPFTMAYSATIGDARLFGFETGIQAPFFALPGGFPAQNTGLYMPNDTPDLGVKKRSSREPNKSLRRVARACRRFMDQGGYRSLVVVVSEDERARFMRVAADEGVEVVSYSSKTTPRAAMAKFAAGAGEVLLGTVANYGEGIDLPNGLAPITFFLRPGYANPTDPAVQFERKRYTQGQYWAMARWRVMIEALQVRGRNVRSDRDRGVTIFVSQQFEGFLYGSLPSWLQPSYHGGMDFDQCCDHALTLLAAPQGDA